MALGASSLGSPSFDLVNHGTLNVTTTGPDVAFAIGANFVNTNLTLVKRGAPLMKRGRGACERKSVDGCRARFEPRHSGVTGLVFILCVFVCRP